MPLAIALRGTFARWGAFAVRAGFGAFVARKLPTREAIDMARKYRVTLIGDVENGHLKVFSGLQPVG